MSATPCFFCGMEDLEFWETYDAERPWLTPDESHVQLLTMGRGMAHRDCIPSPSDISRTTEAARDAFSEECAKILKNVEALFCVCVYSVPAKNTVVPVCSHCRKPLKNGVGQR